jgi:CheY-like chemotaxis protein
VALMGGEIGCRTWQVGGRDAGNEFWLTLPIRAMPASAAGASLPAMALRRCLPRTRILLVEDVAANQMVTATLLRRAGHLVDVVGNGREAISAAATQPYDLVLMDIFMPVLSGLEAARQIRGLGGPAATMPIVALTANICPEDQDACAAAGMNAMLGKPLATNELLEMIARQVWPHRARSPAIALGESLADPATSSVLSAARVNELRISLPAETLANLIEGCLADLSDRFVSLRDAVSQHDSARMLACVHAMAGMSAEYGMAALEARLRALLATSRQEPDAGGLRLVDDIEEELSRTAAVLRETLGTPA